jgi:hypothetical protein
MLIYLQTPAHELDLRCVRWTNIPGHGVVGAVSQEMVQGTKSQS